VSPEDDLFQRLQGAEAKKPTAPISIELEKEVLTADPDASIPITLATIFTHHDTHPLVIDFALLKMFGVSWMGWEPETIWSEVQSAFKSQIRETARAKVQVLKSLHTSNLPWEKWQVMEKVLQGLNNNIPRWDVMQAPALEQIYVGIDIIDQIRHVDFSDEVKLYLAAAVLNDEVCFVPEPLDFIQVELAQPKVVCLDCGNQDSALFHDGICDTCSRKYAPEQGLSQRPQPDRVAKGKGTNTKIVPTYDPEPVRERWAVIGHLPIDGADLEENSVDVQVAKLLLARDYMNLRRRQLAEQLTGLRSWLSVPASQSTRGVDGVSS
jgi:hypothetical protein